MMSGGSVFEWLHSLDLSHYYEPFLQNGYDQLILCAEIGESDLERIGIWDIHEKIEILQAIRHLRSISSCPPNNNGNYLEYSQPIGSSDLSHHPIGQWSNGDSSGGDYQELDDNLIPTSYPLSTSNKRRQPIHNLSIRRSSQVSKSSEISQIFPKHQPLNSTIQNHQLIINNNRPRLIHPESSPASRKPLQFSAQHPHHHHPPHLYGRNDSSLRTNDTISVDLVDPDSSSGIEPDLLPRTRNFIGQHHPKSFGQYSTTSASTNTTASSSSTPDEQQLVHFPRTTNPNLQPDGNENLRNLKSWYRGPVPTLLKPSQLSPNYTLDVLQLRSRPGSEQFLRNVTNGISPNKSCRPQPKHGVPTVSGMVALNAPVTFHGSATPEKLMAANQNSREFDYEDISSNTYEDINNSGSLLPNYLKTPSSHHHHQYLQHVIVSSGSPGFQGLPATPLRLISPTKSRQIYTPGIYSPSSCMLDRDDIYDYAPPLSKQSSTPTKRCSPFRSKGKSKSKSSLTCVTSSSIGDVQIQLDPKDKTHLEYHSFATLRGSRGSGRSTPPSNTLHRNYSSPPTWTHLSDRTTKGGGGVNGPKLLSSVPSSPSSRGSRGCSTLSRLSRRLGLTRLFRSFRIQSGRASLPIPPPPALSIPLPSLPPNRTLKSTNVDRTRWDTFSTGFDEKDNTNSAISLTPLTSSLPSNERIIETINRLKLEELQRRKDRISQEHKMILKDLKCSLTSGTEVTQRKTPSTPPSSIFYVSATVESSGTEDDLEVKSSLLNKRTLSGHYLDQESNSKRELTDSHLRTTLSNTSKLTESGMGGTVSIPEEEEKSTVVGPRWKKNENEVGRSRESWNEKTFSSVSSNSSSCRTSSSSNYHSEDSPMENIPPEHQGFKVPVPSSSLGTSLAGKNSGTGSFDQSSNRENGEELSRESVDSIRNIDDSQDHHHPPIVSTPPMGTSPSKTLLSKVRELSVKNQKRFRRFSFSKSPSSDQQSHHHDGHHRRGSESILSTFSGKQRSLSVDIHRNSSEDEECFSSLQLQILPSLPGSLETLEEYSGPFVGRAVAIHDCVSSPYDPHALSYKEGDIIEIIEKRPTGTWKGKLNNRVGNFKFINVQVLPEEMVANGGIELSGKDDSQMASYPTTSSPTSGFDSFSARGRRRATSPLTPWEMETRQAVANVINGIRKENAALLLRNSEQGDIFSGEIGESSYQKKSKSLGRNRKSSSSSLKRRRPRSVGDLLQRINLEQHISVFILHGFESLDLFKELEEEDLDRLAITNSTDRLKILMAVEFLREYSESEEVPPIIIPTYSSTSVPSNSEKDDDLLDQILEPPPDFTRCVGPTRDSGVYVKCDEKDEADPEVDEIILSPANLLPIEVTQDSVISESTSSAMTDHPSLEEHYGDVRQRFLQARSLFEKPMEEVKSQPIKSPKKICHLIPQHPQPQFLYCEKSSDSGISIGANSPPPSALE